MPDPIYLDHAATTPVRAEVREAMEPFYGPRFGNPSSTHRWGREARAALDEARERVAKCIGATSDEIAFTSGGTEGDNLAILGAFRALKSKGKRVAVTTPIEHKAVLAAVHHVAAEGGEERIVSVDANGVVDRKSYDAATGRRCRDRLGDVGEQRDRHDPGHPRPRGRGQGARRALPHRRRAGVRQSAQSTRSRSRSTTSRSPATRSARPRASARCTSAAARRSSRCSIGGSQNRGQRPGTENVAAAVGLARAAELTMAEMDEELKRLTALRDKLQAALLANIPDAVVHAAGAPRAAHVLSISVPGTDSESLLMALDLSGIACSSGSACQSGSVDPSHVLCAIGSPRDVAVAAIRMSLGSLTTAEQLDRVAQVFPEAGRQGAPPRGRRELIMPRERVLVAMSGGVDSSVAAAVLAEQGYDVIGVTMKLFCYGEDVPDRPCCSLDSIDDARRVCERVGVPHYVLNLETAFSRDVVRDFVHEYDARPHADPVRALQHLHEVPRSRAQGRCARCALDRHRPLCARDERRAPPRPRSPEGPELFPLGDRPRRGVAHAAAGGRPEQGRDARPRPRARAVGGEREAGEPGHLFRARRRSREGDRARARRGYAVALSPARS